MSCGKKYGLVAYVHSKVSLIALVTVIFVLTVLLVLVGTLVLRCFVGVGLLNVQIWENEIKDVAVPVCRSSLDPFLDVLVV